VLPEETFKFKRRRNHNNTPQSILLIITNFIVVSLGVTFCSTPKHIHWFFWVIGGLLAVYNVYTVRRNVHEFNKPTTIAYGISVVVLVALVFILKSR